MLWLLILQVPGQGQSEFSITAGCRQASCAGTAGAAGALYMYYEDNDDDDDGALWWGLRTKDCDGYLVFVHLSYSY